MSLGYNDLRDATSSRVQPDDYRMACERIRRLNFQRIVQKPNDIEAITWITYHEPTLFPIWANRLLASTGSAGSMLQSVATQTALAATGAFDIKCIQRLFGLAARALPRNWEAAAVAALAASRSGVARSDVRQFHELVVSVGLMDLFVGAESWPASVLSGALRCLARERGRTDPYRNVIALTGITSALPRAIALILWNEGWARLLRAIPRRQFLGENIFDKKQANSVVQTLSILDRSEGGSIIVPILQGQLIESVVSYWSDDILRRLNDDMSLNSAKNAIVKDCSSEKYGIIFEQFALLTLGNIAIRLCLDDQLWISIRDSFKKIAHNVDIIKRVDPKLLAGFRVIIPDTNYEYFGYRRDIPSGNAAAVIPERPMPSPKYDGRRNSDAMHCVELRNSIVTPNLLVIIENKYYLNPEFLHYPTGIGGSSRDPYFINKYNEVMWISDDYLMIKNITINDRYIDQAVLVSGISYVESYGHFVFNCLPKIIELIDNGYINEKTSIILGNRIYNFQIELLSILGIKESQLVSLDFSSISVGCLRVMEESPQGLLCYGVLQKLRSRFALPEPPNRIPMLFVARSSHFRRAIKGYDMLASELLDRGFEFLIPEEHSVRDQIAYFDAADIVLSFHGSALATLMFCRPGKIVIEIETKTSLSPTVLNALGHKHYVIKSTIDPNAKSGEDGYIINFIDILSSVDTVLSRYKNSGLNA